MRRLTGVVAVAVLVLLIGVPSSFANCVNPGTTEPFGTVEWPPEGYVAVNPQDFRVSGWALSTVCMNRVRFFIDGIETPKCCEGVTLTVERNDVCTTFCRSNYPNCRGECPPPDGTPGTEDNVGWEILLDVSGFNMGWHLLEVKAFDDAGRNNVIGSVNFLIPRPFGNIEGPYRVLCGRDCPTNGWALAGLGLEKLMLFMDDAYIGDADLGGSRPDVCNSYAGYINPVCESSGWTMNVNYSSECLASQRRIRAVAVDNLGNETDLYAGPDPLVQEGNGLQVQVDCPPCSPVAPFGLIDLPVNGQEISKERDFVMTGWSFAADTLENVTIHLNGDPVAHADLENAPKRPDLCAAICYPNCEDGGWAFPYSSDDLELGDNVFKAVAEDSEGRSTVLGTRTVHVREVQAPIGRVELPATNQVVVIGRDPLQVLGWTVADRFDPEKRGSVEKIEFYLDAQLLGTLTEYDAEAEATDSLGLLRPDVCTAQGSDYYQYPKCIVSGFAFTLKDTSGLNPGLSLLRVRVYDKEGLSADLNTVPVTIAKE